MVCGQDAHGGNNQNGCGHRFRWTEAQQYRAAAAPVAQANVMSAEDLLRGEHEGISCKICACVDHTSSVSVAVVPSRPNA